MTVAELIRLVMGSIERDHYEDRPREFSRDYRALEKAIASYGYHCADRGWHFEPREILREIMSVLISMRGKRETIGYLPIYLAGAIKRHCGMKAEEFATRARAIKPRINRIVEGTKITVIVEPSGAEILAAVYKDLRKPRAKKSSPKPPPVKPAETQPTLF
jgi:hypothetical protein